MNQPEMGGGPGAVPSDEEMRAQLEAELKRLRVEDVLLQTVVSLINLGARRAGLTGGDPAELDLEQVRSAVDASSAVLPVLERGMGADELRPLRDALSQLQMAYAQRSGASAAAGAAAPAPEAGEAQPASQDPPASGPGPAQSRGRLWVPGQ